MSLVSVILPTFNRAWCLQRAIESVLAQTFKDFELFIIDDGSTDNTHEILKNYNQLKIIKTKNLGVSSARNIAVSNSDSKYISFIDSDDEWHPRKLEEQINFLANNQNYRWVHSNEKWIRNGQHLNQKKIHKKSGGDQFFKSLELCIISPSTVMLERDIFNEFSGFREDFPVCEDYDLWLKLTSKYPIGFIEDVLITKYGGHEDQLSQKFKAMDYWRVQSIHWVLQNSNLSNEQKIYAIEIFKNKCEILIKGYKKYNNAEKLKFIEELLINYSL